MLIPYRATHNQVLSVFSIWKQRGKEKKDKKIKSTDVRKIGFEMH